MGVKGAHKDYWGYPAVCRGCIEIMGKENGNYYNVLF